MTAGLLLVTGACASSAPCSSANCETGSNTKGTGSESDTGSESETGTDSESDTNASDGAVACGGSDCLPGEVCLHQFVGPTCTNKENPDDMCPEGQQDTNCGGAGIPCCCEPGPGPTMTCDPASNCDGAITCACLAEACGVENLCGDQGDGVFFCEPAPAP
ncbi:MAG: hypothetical protein ACPG4T_04945 [Nannocystaceae bacterium]